MEIDNIKFNTIFHRNPADLFTLNHFCRTFCFCLPHSIICETKPLTNSFWSFRIAAIVMLVFLFTVGVVSNQNIYLFKFNNKNTRKRCEICSKLTIKTPVYHTSCSVFIVNFEQVNVYWELTDEREFIFTS